MFFYGKDVLIYIKKYMTEKAIKHVRIVMEQHDLNLYLEIQKWKRKF